MFNLDPQRRNYKESHTEKDFSIRPYPYYRKSHTNNSSISFNPTLSMEETIKELAKERKIESPTRNVRFYWEPLSYGSVEKIRDVFFENYVLEWPEMGRKVRYRPIDLLDYLNVDYSTVLLFGPSAASFCGFEYLLNLQASYLKMSTSELKSLLDKDSLIELQKKFEKNSLIQIAIPTSENALLKISNFFHFKIQMRSQNIKPMSFMEVRNHEGATIVKIGQIQFFFYSTKQRFVPFYRSHPQINLSFLSKNSSLNEVYPSLPDNLTTLTELFVRAGELTNYFGGYLSGITKGEIHPSLQTGKNYLETFLNNREKLSSELFYISSYLQDYPSSNLALLWNAEYSLFCPTNLETFSLFSEIHEIFNERNFVAQNCFEKILNDWGQNKINFRKAAALIRLYYFLTEGTQNNRIELKNSLNSSYIHLPPCEHLWKELLDLFEKLDSEEGKSVLDLIKNIFETVDKSVLEIPSCQIELFLKSEQPLLWQLGYSLFFANIENTNSLQLLALRKAYLFFSLDEKEKQGFFKKYLKKSGMDLTSIYFGNEKTPNDETWLLCLASSKDLNLKNGALKIWEEKIAEQGFVDSDLAFLGTTLIGLFTPLAFGNVCKILERLYECNFLTASNVYEYLDKLCGETEELEAEHTEMLMPLLTMLSKSKEKVSKSFKSDSPIIKRIKGLKDRNIALALLDGSEISLPIEEILKLFKELEAEKESSTKNFSQLSSKLKALFEKVKKTPLETNEESITYVSEVLLKFFENFDKFSKQKDLINQIAANLEKIFNASLKMGLYADSLILIQKIARFSPQIFPNSVSFQGVIEQILETALKDKNLAEEASNVLKLFIEKILKQDADKIKLFKTVYSLLPLQLQAYFLNYLFENTLNNFENDQEFLLKILKNLSTQQLYEEIISLFEPLKKLEWVFTDPDFKKFWLEISSNLADEGQIYFLKKFIIFSQPSTLSKDVLDKILNSISEKLSNEDLTILCCFLIPRQLVDKNIYFPLIAQNLDRVDRLKISDQFFICSLSYFNDRENGHDEFLQQYFLILLKHSSLSLTALFSMVKIAEKTNKDYSEYYFPLLNSILEKWDNQDKAIFVQAVETFFTLRPEKITTEQFHQEYQFANLLLQQKNCNYLGLSLELIHLLFESDPYKQNEKEKKLLDNLYLKVLAEMLAFDGAVKETDRAVNIVPKKIFQCVTESAEAQLYWLLILNKQSARSSFFLLSRCILILREFIEKKVDQPFLNLLSNHQQAFKNACNRIAEQSFSPNIANALFAILTNPKVKSVLKDRDFPLIAKKMLLLGLRSIQEEIDMPTVKLFLETFRLNMEIYKNDMDGFETIAMIVSDRFFRIRPEYEEETFCADGRRDLLNFLEQALKGKSKKKAETILVKMGYQGIRFLKSYYKSPTIVPEIFYGAFNFLNEVLRIYFSYSDTGNANQAELLFSYLNLEIYCRSLFDENSPASLISKELAILFFSSSAYFNEENEKAFMLYHVAQILHPDFKAKNMSELWSLKLFDFKRIITECTLFWILEVKHPCAIEKAFEYLKLRQKELKKDELLCLVPRFKNFIEELTVSMQSFKSQINLIGALFKNLNEGAILEHIAIIPALLDLLKAQYLIISRNEDGFFAKEFFVVKNMEEAKKIVLQSIIIVKRYAPLLKTLLQNYDPEQKLNYIEYINHFAGIVCFLVKFLDTYPEEAKRFCNEDPVNLIDEIFNFYELYSKDLNTLKPCLESKISVISSFLTCLNINPETINRSKLFEKVRPLDRCITSQEQRLTKAIANDDWEYLNQFIEESQTETWPSSDLAKMQIGDYNFLQVACFYGSKRIIEYLTEHFPEIMKCSMSPLQIACRQQYDDVAQLLLEKKILGCITEEELLISLEEVCSINDEKRIINLLNLFLIELGKEKFIDLFSNQMKEKEDVLFIKCFKAYKIAVVEFLLNLGISPNIKERFGNPLMHMICQLFDEKRRRPLFTLVLSKNPDLYLKNNANQTLFEAVCLNAVSEIFDFLSFDLEDVAPDPLKENATPFIAAAKNGSVKFFEILLECYEKKLKLDPKTIAEQLNFKNKLCTNPLLIAAENGNYKLVNYLFSQPYIDLLVRDHKNRSILDLAIRNGSSDLVKLVIAGLTNPLNLNSDEEIISPNPGISSPLHQVYTMKKKKSKNSKKILRLLISYGVNFRSIDTNGQTVFHLAASMPLDIDERDQNLDSRKKREKMLLLLLEAAKKRGETHLVNQPDVRGDTPLHCAYAYNNETGIRFLLRNGANSGLTNKEGNLPDQVQKKYPCNKSLETEIIEFKEDEKEKEL